MKYPHGMSYQKLTKRYLNLFRLIFLWNLVSFAIVLLVSPMFGDPFSILPLTSLLSLLIGTSIGIVVFQHKFGQGKRSK